MKILLVDLDKDYIRRTESSSEFKLNLDLFAEALDNLRADIKGWTSNSGINIELQSVNETVTQEHNFIVAGKSSSGPAIITHTHTRVYGILESEDDLAWLTMSLGEIKPATKLTKGEYRGWQFKWS